VTGIPTAALIACAVIVLALGALLSAGESALLRFTRAAADDNAELFLAPKDNCADLRGKDFGAMKIVSVATLEEAITQMDNYAAGNDLHLCE